MIYLTGHSSAIVREFAWSWPIGLMAQPTNGYAAQVGDWPVWAADNGCYAQGDRFSLDRYLTWLGRLVPYRDTCFFAPAPDVVGDMAATLARSLPVLPEIRAKGFKAALVAQDGAERLDLPWETFDALFIGGTTAWKESEAIVGLVREAKAQGKWAHMGRVNSQDRLKRATMLGCDSVDGTYLAFGPDTNLPKLLRWLNAQVLPFGPSRVPAEAQPR